MNEFEKITESESYRARKNRQEGREVDAEKKEKQVEEAEKKLAAKERLEQTSREIKTTKQQIHNIVANMTAVLKAVQAIRAQLQLQQNDDDIPSVKRDEKVLEGLKRKLDGLYGEINDLKGALLAEERKAAQEEFPSWSAVEINAEAQRRVVEILTRVGVVV